MADSRRAVVLLSGGIDSTTTLVFAQRQGFDVHALSFSYGQRHSVELDAARRVALSHEVADHRIVEIDLRQFGGSALTGDLEVPRDRSAEEMAEGIPVTYVPARNTIFLSFALGWSEVLGAQDIFLGVNALDYAGYPDCRPDYIEAFEKMARLATRSGVESKGSLTLHTPLIRMTKAEIISKGLELGIDYGLTVTCYDPSPEQGACGHCDACVLRLDGFQSNGLSDPIRYREVSHATA